MNILRHETCRHSLKYFRKCLRVKLIGLNKTVKGRVKFILEQATKSQRGSNDIALFFL
jgi:hypothetical protein